MFFLFLSLSANVANVRKEKKIVKKEEGSRRHQYRLLPKQPTNCVVLVKKKT